MCIRDRGKATFNASVTAPQFLVSGNTGVQGIQIGEDSSNSSNSGRLFFTESGGSWAIFNSNDSLSFNNGGTYGSSSGTQRAFLTAAGDLNIDGTFTSGGVLAVNSGTTNTVATFTSTDSGAGFNLTDDSGTSTIQTNGANLRIGVDEDGAVSSSAIQFRVDGSTKATINDSGVLDVDGGITVDDITIDGTEIDLSSGDLTIDVAGDITLDADGADIRLSDGGTEFGRFTKSGNDFELRSTVTNGDFKIIGIRTSGTVNAMTIDMSDGGAVSFNSKITSNNIQLENGFLSQTSGDLTLDVAGDINLDADGGEILLLSLIHISEPTRPY